MKSILILLVVISFAMAFKVPFSEGETYVRAEPNEYPEIPKINHPINQLQRLYIKDTESELYPLIQSLKNKFNNKADKKTKMTVTITHGSKGTDVEAKINKNVYENPNGLTSIEGNMFYKRHYGKEGDIGEQEYGTVFDITKKLN